MPRSTLLVIDDEPNILTTRPARARARGLRRRGGRLRRRSASAKLDERDIDLVLLDVMMPEMNGLDVLPKHPRRSTRTWSVVMMSGNATIETAVQATKLGAHDFVEKPLSADKLLLTVQNTLAVRAAAPRERAAARPGARPTSR